VDYNCRDGREEAAALDLHWNRLSFLKMEVVSDLFRAAVSSAITGQSWQMNGEHMGRFHEHS
jgi:hypothetical protein